MQYSFSRTVDFSFGEAIERVTEEMKKEGFGVLTSIDVKDIFKKKLDVEFTRYVILGACNPPLALAVLTSDIEAGLLLPCNVIVYEKEGRTVVSIFDPMTIVQVLEKSTLRPIAEEVQKKLKRVLANV
jgi:uncharacterized protein (DUF302 family)